MRKAIRTALIIGAALLLAPVAALSATITFNDLSVTTVVTNQYASSGVLFSITGGQEYVANVGTLDPFGNAIGSFPGYLGSQFLGVWTVPLYGTAASLTATFVDPTNSSIPGIVSGSTISVYVADTEQGVKLESFDLNNVLLETKNLTSGYATITFTTGLVHSIRFTDTAGDGHIIDNFTYGPIIPEPSTFALIGGSLLILGLVMRRRR